MIRRRGPLALAMAVALTLAVTPMVAQDEATEEPMHDMSGIGVEVTGVEYAFLGLPRELPVGSEISFTNEGAELHEIVIVRIADGVTEHIYELLALAAEGRDLMAEGLVEMVGQGPLVAPPGMAAEGTLVLDRTGEYLALCFIPQGFDPAVFKANGVDLMAMGPDTDISTLPEEIQAIFGNRPHFRSGMYQQFVVTDAEAMEGAEA